MSEIANFFEMAFCAHTVKSPMIMPDQLPEFFSSQTNVTFRTSNLLLQQDSFGPTLLPPEQRRRSSDAVAQSNTRATKTSNQEQRMVLSFALKAFRLPSSASPTALFAQRSTCRSRPPLLSLAMPPPPPAVVPDVPIDRSVFAQTWRLYALPVAPRLTQNAVDALKKHVLRVPRIQTVAKGRGGAAEKLVLLRYFVGEVPEVPPALRGNLELEGGDRGAVAERLRKEGEERAAVVEEVVADGDYGKGEGNGEGAEEVEGKKKKKKKKSGKNGAEVVELLNSVTAESLVEHEIQVGYEQWSMEAVLTRLLPEGMTMLVCLALRDPLFSSSSPNAFNLYLSPP